MIDLRDQQENFSLAGRSRDGIRIRAEDVQVIYSLRRSSLDSTYQRPYPFREEAIRRLVYDQFFESGRQSWQVAIGEAIRGELWDFFIQHPLEEFLANTAGPEMRKEELDKNSIQEEGNRLAGLDELVYHANEKGRKAKFVARSQLSELFYGSNNSKAVQRMMQSGVDMHWIGVGTWILPAESISTRHEEAWRITKDNLIRGYPGALEGVQRSSYLAEMIRLVNETTISVYKDLIKEELSIKNLSSFISRYQTNLRQACEYLQ